MNTNNNESFFYDLHCHTRKSYDSISKLEKIIKIAKKRGLDGIAITDHDVLYQGETNIDGIQIIPGVEITLKDQAHLLAYFIKEPLEKCKFNLEEAVKEIKRQGGYCSLAHPYRRGEGWVKVKKRNKEEIRKAINLVDAVELNNFKSPPRQKLKLKKLLKSLNINKPLSAGSDAHIPGDVGFSVLKTKEKINDKNFLNVLSNSESVTQKDKDNYKKISILIQEPLTALTKKLGLYYNRVARKLYHHIIFYPFLIILNFFRSKVDFNLKKG